MGEYKLIGKNIPRDDAVAKVTGSQQFFADMPLPEALHGAVVRAAHPHAEILDIDTSRAIEAPGVVDVLTWKDVPGVNLFGIGGLDQPVLCQDKTRFIGDSVALVVARTEDEARQACDLVSVDYRPLPLIGDAQKAKAADGPTVRGESNVASRFAYRTGNVEQYFTDQYVVAENDFQTQYQEHAYLETEIAFAQPTPEGGMEVWAPAQYAFRDRMQLAKILALPEEKIICHATPIGGGFGGKDDMHMQPLAAVAAQKLGRLVRVQLNREESFLYSTKRVPFTFHMKTAADREGNLVAHQVQAVGDIGPYTGISVAVFNYGVENACGAYFFPNIDILGEAVFTNNAHTGSFRGFGNNQLNYGLETQLDEIAAKLGMDRLALRAKNLTKTGQRLSYGHLHEGCDGLQASFEALARSSLWKNQAAFKQAAAHPWLKRGVGIATGQHGNGLGNALRDEGMARVQLQQDGTLHCYVGLSEMGQGLETVCHMAAAEKAQVPYDQVRITLGDTALCPDGGPTTASRSTYVACNAICTALDALLERVAAELRGRYGQVSHGQGGMVCDGQLRDWRTLAGHVETREALGKCVVPTTDLKLQIGLHCMHTHVTQVTGVEVNTLTGKVDVLETEILPAAGTVLNRLGYEGQCQGGVVMAMGYAVMEDYQFGADGRPLTRNFQTYLVPTVRDIPRIRITPIETYERTGPYGAKGLGEPVTIPGTPAITNAICDAIGKQIRQLPATPERILTLLQP